MRRIGWGALLALACACGAGGRGLPTGTAPGDAPGTPGQPPDHQPTDAQTSLWPLTTGSTWTYRITDPVNGVFEKHVAVLGVSAVPGMPGTNAVQVDNDEPALDELSWQVISNGVVLRMREEDRKQGQLVRATTFSPSEMKALATGQASGWTQSTTVRESEYDPSGTLTSEKDKTYVWTVESVDETVTVPAGTFQHALRLKRERTDKPDYLRRYWLVPGVGKVREEGERTEELSSYDVKP